MRSMAITGYSSTYILVQSPGSVLRPARKTFMVKQSQVPILKTPALKIRSSVQNKVVTSQHNPVFEDKLEGIICYRDENGEMVCEGYDEGPRFPRQIPTTTYDPRDAEIMNILLQRWLDIVNNGESSKADKGVAVKEDINGNGFNSFY
ncbi:hypothetical protein Pint_29448 [Pistacia integerrima]|uniref:Uncharacterized protein n=1 Tax=Pistacia integerrima TaxID=434235 RepID=A0ACC0X1Y9_9ROSI|nr:hypothetical protein Pint_29448 [Pistacia integerrima]